MITKWIYVFAALVAIDISGLQPAEACSCMPTHPQVEYCKSDFAVVARVKRQVRSDKNNNVYRVIVRKVFKASEKARVAFKSSKVYTPLDDGICGRELLLNQTYLLTGNVYHLQAHVNTCNYAEPWRKVTPRQRKGFRLLYKQGCACKISMKPRRKNHELASKHTCLWTNPMTSEDCFAPHGICFINRLGKCGWAKSPVLSKCLLRNKLASQTLRRYSKT